MLYRSASNVNHGIISSIDGSSVICGSVVSDRTAADGNFGGFTISTCCHHPTIRGGVVFDVSSHQIDVKGISEEVAEALTKAPRFLLRLAIAALRVLDYFGLIPDSLIEASPFHGSMIITDMGSLRLGKAWRGASPSLSLSHIPFWSETRAAIDFRG